MCGAGYTVHFALLVHVSAAVAVAEMGVFSAAWRLHRLITPALPSAEWWSSTATVVDAMSVHVSCSWAILNNLRHLPAAQVVSLDVWEPLLAESVEMVKVNQSAQLSAADTMCQLPFHFACVILEVAARDELQHAGLMSGGAVDALEYICVHDFAVIGTSLAVYAAGAVVELDHSQGLI